MTIKVGTVVGTEFGNGTVIAITEEWVVVHIYESGNEVALHREDQPVWVAATDHEIGGGQEQTIQY